MRGRTLLIGLALALTALFIGAPVAAVFAQAFSKPSA
jgi:ABC-type sulfate transport system permease subunit